MGSARPATLTRSGPGVLTSLRRRSPHVRTESPLTAVMRSPRRSAARAPARGGSSLTTTESTCVVAMLSGPRAPANASPEYTANANTAFIVTPARTTTKRAHRGLRSNARAGSTGTGLLPPSRAPAGPSSSTPAILTYPPNGIHEIQYSVSPRRKLTTGRPNPSENRSTWMPTAFAAMKWPASCTKMSTPRTTANAASVRSMRTPAPGGAPPRPPRAPPRGCSPRSAGTIGARARSSARCARSGFSPRGTTPPPLRSRR